MADVTDLTAYPIGGESLAPLKRNASDLDKLINNTGGTVENRAGDTLRTYAQLEDDFQADGAAAVAAFEADGTAAIATYTMFTARGDWTTATAYALNDVWTDTVSGDKYLVLAAYTSGANEAADIAGGNVTLFRGRYTELATSLAELSATPVVFEGQAVDLTAGGRSGQFIWTLGDFSVEVAADTLQGVYVASDTVLDTVGVWKRKLDGYVTPKMFGLDSGELTQSVLDSMVSIGTKIDFGIGDFDLVEPLTTTNKNIDIVGSCTFNVLYTSNPSGYTPLTLTAEYTDEQSVSANSIVSYDFGGGNTQVSRLTITTASDYAVGDTVKIVSEDLIDGLNPTDVQKNGESHIVGAVDAVNNYIYLLSTLRETYSTTVRVFKYSDYTLNISGNIKFTGRSGHAGSTRNETILVKGYKNPKVSLLSAEEITGEFLSLLGCCKAETNGISGSDLLTDTANNQYGYVISERSCGYGVHREPSGVDVRHVYTDGAGFNPASTEPYAYGRNENANVYDLIGVNCQSSAADTHPESFGCTFHNPVSNKPYRGEDGALWCVQLRGQNGTAINPVSDGGDAVVIRAEYASANGCKGHRVLGLTRRQKSGETNQSAPVRVLGISGGRVSDVKIINPDITMTGDDGPLFEFEYADVEIHNPKTTTNITGASTGHAFALTDSIVKVFDGHTDLSQSTGTNIRYARLADSASSIVFLDHKLTRGAADLEYLADFTADNGKAHFIDLKIDSAPNTVNSANNGGTQDYLVSYTNDYGAGVKSGYLTTTKTVNFTLGGLNIDRIADDEISVIVDSSGAAGDINCTSIPISGRVGQRLRIANKAGATFNIIIQTTTTNVSIDTDITIAPSRSYTLISDGTAWGG